MWKFLYKLASPRTFYQWTHSWLPALGWAAFVILLVGTIWGLGFAPADYQQGDAYRIIFIHVPAAFLSITLYSAMAFFALLLLVWRIKIAGLMLSVTAPIGASMAFLALCTGSIWGKPMWGAWWVWDARLTSELILLLLYAAIMAVSNAFNNRDQADKITAILTLIGLVDLPIIHYSVYWWNTLHQGATLSVFAKPEIAAPMLYPLLIMIAGFSLYSLWMVLSRAGNELLLRERGQRWVKRFIQEGQL